MGSAVVEHPAKDQMSEGGGQMIYRMIETVR